MTLCRWAAAAAFAFASLVALPACRAEPQAVEAPPHSAARAATDLDIVPLSLCGDAGCRNFEVEVARSPDQQARGLMFRESLGRERGMLFPFPSPRPASFWMKNTLIPLDMIFIRADGTIARIAANTVPHSLEPVGVAEPVAAVLEIAGGRAAQLGIREGDRATWPGGPAR